MFHNTPKTLWADTEDFSVTPIASGHHRYAEDAEVLLWAFAWGEGEKQVWDMPAGYFGLEDIQRQINEAERVVFHNAQFDLAVLRQNGITIPIEKVHCTMTQALAHGLVGKLEQLCDVLKVPQDKAKIKDGKKLIQLFCKPGAKNAKIKRATSETHPDKWAQFIEYAGADVDAMREVWRRLPRWNCSPSETLLWQLDQRINDRGIAVDLDLAHAAIRAFERTSRALAALTAEITDGTVGSTTQRDALIGYCRDVLRVDLDNLQKGNVEAILRKGDLDPVLRELLGIRLEAAAASPAKYKAILKSACKDGRIRGMTQFCGAARTGRDAGRIVQLQNLPRPSMEADAIEIAIAAMKADVEHFIYANVSDICVNSVRGALVAGPKKLLVLADLSNIEGRVLAWGAGEAWKIEAFKRFDRGEGPDIYKVTAGRILNKDAADITKLERQEMGKVPELACGYQGSVGAFRTMGGRAVEGMSDDHILGIVQGWRAGHPRTVAFWYALERAAKDAIRNPAEMFSVNGVATFDMAKHGEDWYLRMRLPSGRYLCYKNPELIDGTITFEGLNQYSRKWQVLDTYGGKLAENWTQAVARDVFMNGLMLAERHGYPVVLRVHDELGAEIADNDNERSHEGLAALMATGTSWTVGLPLAAAGFTTRRYRKE